MSNDYHTYHSKKIFWYLLKIFYHVYRETVDSTEDGWVISDGPDSLDIATQIQKSLMELAHD